MKGRILIFLLLLNTLISRGQFYNRPFIVRADMHTGFNIPVYKALGYIIKDDIFAADISIGFQATGKNYWEKLYNFPTTGAGFSAWSLGNRDILGNAYAVYGFTSVPFDKDPRRFSLNFKGSAGAAWLPLKFDLKENPLNRAIGSNCNIFIRLAIEGKYRLSPLCDLIAGAGLAHFSNGKTHSPNYGINTGTVSLGLNYNFNHNNYIRSDPEIPVPDKKLVHSIFISAGPKVYDNLYGYRYLSATLSYDMGKNINNLGKAGGGIDLFYDGSIGEALSERGVMEDRLIRLMRAGVHVSYSMRCNRMSAGLQAGYYLYSKSIVLTSIYNKIFLQYMFTKKIAGNVSIRSHWGKADCLEYGVGYIW